MDQGRNSECWKNNYFKSLTVTKQATCKIQIISGVKSFILLLIILRPQIDDVVLSKSFHKQHCQ